MMCKKHTMMDTLDTLIKSGKNKDIFIISEQGLKNLRSIKYILAGLKISKDNLDELIEICGEFDSLDNAYHDIGIWFKERGFKIE